MHLSEKIQILRKQRCKMIKNIRPLTVAHLPEYAEVIRQSFTTVASDYGLTVENCPGHWSYKTNER